MAGQVIIIPKQLRMEWTDTLALDRDLSHVAFRVACVIGMHFNNRSGDTFVSQETVARVMAISPRTVWGAIAELERAGYVIIARRELPSHVRETKDGRKIVIRGAGGRGVANTYLPAFESSQVTATNTGRKLAAQCDLWWKERSQNPASKVAADCEPTLNSPSESNSTRASEITFEEGDHRLGELRRQLGPEVFDAWIVRSSAQFEIASEDAVLVRVRTRLARSELKTRFGEVIARCWNVKRVDVVLDGHQQVARR